MTATVTTDRGAPAAGAPRPAVRRPREPLVGTRAMVGLVVRRNRVRLVVWFLVVAGMFGYVGAYYGTLFTTQAALDDFAALSSTPSIRALTGLSAAPATLGGAVWTKIWMFDAVMLAFAVAFLVTRNGRADEELGRTELLRSRVLGIGEGFISEPWWCRTLVLSAERTARRDGIVRVAVAARHLRRPGPRQAMLDAVDLSLMHECTPGVYQWMPYSALTDAA